MRILVTGSRGWTDEFVIANTLATYYQDMREYPVEPVTVVHGACPKGADAITDRIVKDWPGWTLEPHPADWSMGKQAGHWRNQHMVNLGADVCFAFWDGTSRGTADCIARAREAGIHTIVITEHKP